MNNKYHNYYTFTIGSWSSTSTVPAESPLEKVELPGDCEMECFHENNCTGFVHQFSTQKCWLMDDISTITPSEERNYVGPRNCAGRIDELQFI